MAILRTLIEKVVVTSNTADVEVSLYGELGALLELAEARKQGCPVGLGAEAFAVSGCGGGKPPTVDSATRCCLRHNIFIHRIKFRAHN